MVGVDSDVLDGANAAVTGVSSGIGGSPARALAGAGGAIGDLLVRTTGRVR